MHRIDTDRATEEGLFQAGDPALGLYPTELDPDWCNDMQENIAQAIEGAGLVLSKGDFTQLLKAIRILGRPIGMGYYYLGDVATLPPFTLHADGSAVSRATYADLWAWVQTSGNLAADAGEKAANPGMFGPGDGLTTFDLPLVEDFVRGVSAGRDVGSYQADAMQGHHHQTPSQYGSSGTTHALATYTDRSGAVDQNESGGLVTDGVNGVPRTADETRPKNTAYPFVITC